LSLANTQLITVIKIWNNELELLFTVDKLHTDGMNDVCFTPDSKFIVTASTDSTVRKIPISTRAERVIGTMKKQEEMAKNNEDCWGMNTEQAADLVLELGMQDE